MIYEDDSLELDEWLSRHSAGIDDDMWAAFEQQWPLLEPDPTDYDPVERDMPTSRRDELLQTIADALNELEEGGQDPWWCDVPDHDIKILGHESGIYLEAVRQHPVGVFWGDPPEGGPGRWIAWL